MKPSLIRMTAYSLGLMLLPAAGDLSAAAAQSVGMQATAGVYQAPTYMPQQLDQLLAPIALYPDPLLAQIMMASTYPLEVVEAARWVQDPNNARLRGDQLAAALEQQDWDPSVKSLVPFPQILQMMDGKLDWTQALGNAFLAQQGDVMDSVQRLRAEARAAGTLQSTPQDVVSNDGQTILIEPANPQLVYVPYYDPRIVYGSWGYPDYPPIYFSPPPNYGYVAGPGIYFGVGFGIINVLWGWDQWDWGHHDISINPDRYNRINNYAIAHDNRPRYTANTWQHDSTHRRGVPYSNPAVRQTFQPTVTGSPDARRSFRGFDNRAGAPAATSPAVTSRTNRAAAPAAVPRPAETGRTGAAQQTTGRPAFAPGGQRPVEAGRGQAAAPPTPTPQTNARLATPPSAGTGRPGAAQQAIGRSAFAPGGQRPVEAGRGQAAVPPTPTPQTNARVTPPPSPRRAPVALGGAAPPPAQRPVAPAFSSFGRGVDVQAQSQRGQASRQATAPAAAPRVAAPARVAAPPARVAAPQTHSAPQTQSAPPQPQPSTSAGSSDKGGRDDKQHH